MGDAPAKARPNKAVEPTAPRAACGSSTSFMARRLTASVRCQRHKGPSVQHHRICTQLVGTSAMSTCKEAIQSGLEESLQDLQRALEGLTPAEVRWQPTLHTQHMAWLVWHMARGEDRWISR